MYEVNEDKRTDAEKALEALLSGDKPDSHQLRYAHEDARRGGSYSLYGRFSAEEQYQWATRVIAHLTDGLDGDDGECPTEFPYDASWDATVQAVRDNHDKHFEARRQNSIACYEAKVQEARNWAEQRKEQVRARFAADDDPPTFDQRHPEVLIRPVGGLAGTLFDQMEIDRINIDPVLPAPPATHDPWDRTHADWFLDNMTLHMVFTIFYVVYAAAHEEMQIELIAWTGSYGRGDEASRAASTAFDKMMERLVAHIGGQVQALAA